ncbi:MAG: DUF2959 family protein [Methylococcaceae bacterium]|nr:DUF2959 family protein [Methylococcaceae bacterium]
MIDAITAFISKRLRGVYYQSKESLGYHKRDLVVAHVEKACHSLEESRDQFSDALDKFKTIISMDETLLEQRYKLLKRQYEFCQHKADDVSHRIKAIEEVSAALFDEWDDELKQYNNRALRSRSRAQLKSSRKHYSKLLKNLGKAESKMKPVLGAFHDQVLFLKHNLNAQAIAALQDEIVVISIDISLLIEIMEDTIREANQFVSVLIEHKSS